MTPWYVFALQGLTPLLNAQTYWLASSLLVVLVCIYITRPRRVYFVRHGETEANAERIRQAEAGSLSEAGRAQAEAAGDYLAQFPIRSMISSPYPRAAETAVIINERLKVPLSYSPLLVERRNPSEVVGKKDDDPAVLKVIDRIDRIYHEDDYRYSDEENFADLKERARRCISLLSRQSPGNVCAVTHSIFLKMVIAYLLFREDLHAKDYVKLSFFNASDNAGIVICEYSPRRIFSATHGWRVVDYNITPYPGGRGDLGSAVPRIPPQIS
ncbi:MAG: histidine phosphatase family protein [bacterium]|nr:histidine phosphatase family protein [bacterium]